VPFGQVARARLRGLGPSQRRVIEHLLAIDPAAPDVTAAGVAATLGVSQATVVNAVQRLGYAGFGDFRRRLIAERAIAGILAGPTSRPSAGRGPANPVVAIRRRVFDEDRAVIAATDRLLDDAAFVAAARTLAAAPQVLCIGAEQSGLVARLAAGTFTKYGIPAVAEDHVAEQMALVEVAGGEHAVFVISYRGRNRALNEVAERAVQRGMAVVALTNSPHAALARIASTVLLTAGPVLPDGLHPNKTGGRAAQFMIVRALAEAVAWLRAQTSLPPGVGDAAGNPP
jgi:RpiR family carbohydrate utilization transcriptional regulator